MNAGFFARNFDDEIKQEAERATTPARRRNIEMSPEELEEKLQAARAEGFERGREQGSGEGKSEALESIASLEGKAIEQIESLLQDLILQRDEHRRLLEEDLSGALLEISQKLLPRIVAETGQKKLEEEVKLAARAAVGSPWLEIRVPENLAAQITEKTSEIRGAAGRTTEVSILSDPTLSGFAVSATWENGRSSYDANLLCEAIMNTISRPALDTSLSSGDSGNE